MRRARAQECGYDADDLAGGGGSNTHHLRAHYGWTGLLLDRGHANASINLHRELISSRNVLELFRKHGVPLEPDYVSIDIDSTDLWVLRALLASPVRPRVVSVEYNCVYGTDAVAATYPDDPDMPWEGDKSSAPRWRPSTWSRTSTAGRWRRSCRVRPPPLLLAQSMWRAYRRRPLLPTPLTP